MTTNYLNSNIMKTDGWTCMVGWLEFNSALNTILVTSHHSKIRQSTFRMQWINYGRQTRGCLVEWCVGIAWDRAFLPNDVNWNFCRALTTVESVEHSLLVSDKARHNAESLPRRTVNCGSAYTHFQFTHNNTIQYNTIHYNIIQYGIHTVPRVASKSEALYGSEACYVISAEEKIVVFKWDLKEANEEEKQRPSSREFQINGTAIEKVHKAK